ncbi:MAG: phosphate ABC transporter permease PstA [Acetatifactor sp.]|nr:phosphate ABC transporter permease PstA [Acetatifactor sp.]
MSDSILAGKRRRPLEAFLLAAVYGAAGLSVFLLLSIIGYVFFRGFRHLSFRFFTTVTSALRGTVGIAGNLVNTLYMIVITLSIAIPVGVGGAIYLNEYAGKGKLVRLIEFATETLAGIPSVVFGLFGMVFFGDVLGLGYSILNGALTLTLMVLPLIVKNTQEALRTTPDSYRNAALGMGATRWYMIRTVLLPSAMPGILTGAILAAGRIVGESAALLFTAGSARLLPKLTGSLGRNLEKLGQKVLEPGGTLTLELYLQTENGEYGTAFGIGCVLLIIALLTNLLLKRAAHKIHDT